MVPTALLSGSACWFLLFAFCSLLSASLFLLVLFLLLAFCFLSLLLSACCFWLHAFCFLLSVSCFGFLPFAFCFYVFWTESKNRCNKAIAITTATITVTLIKDSHYSFYLLNRFLYVFIVANTITGAMITSSFPVTNERTSRNNKRAAKRKKRQMNVKKKINAQMLQSAVFVSGQGCS